MDSGVGTAAAEDKLPGLMVLHTLSVSGTG